MSYPGGKAGAGVYQTIINQVPPHDTYIEPFVGGGAIFHNIRRAVTSIVIDNDPSALAPFQRDPSITAILGDGRQYLRRRKWTGREFVFADPPYLKKTRRSQRDLYLHEWDTADHIEFLKIALDLPCAVAICGYMSDLYADTLVEWRLITYTAQTRRGPATECLWMNYPEPTALHDCRYLGGDFRERERIKRKASRWASNFEAMPPLERQAVLSLMLERAGSCPATYDGARSSVLGPIAASGDDAGIQSGVPGTIAVIGDECRPLPLEVAIADSMLAAAGDAAASFNPGLVKALIARALELRPSEKGFCDAV